MVKTKTYVAYIYLKQKGSQDTSACLGCCRENCDEGEDCYIREDKRGACVQGEDCGEVWIKIGLIG